MLRILHLADLHLGYRPTASAEHASEHSRDYILDRIADYLATVPERPDMLLIAGDLFDSHLPDPSIVRRAIAGIKRIQDYGVVAVTVPGNHDELTYRDSVYRRHEREWPGFLVTNAMLEDPVPLVARGNRVYLISMAYDGNYAAAKEKIRHFPPRQNEALHLCLLHGSLQEAGQQNTGERCLVFDKEALLSRGYDYIALGHEHKPRELRAPQDNSGLLTYAGMIADRDLSDPGCHQLLFVQLERGMAPRAQWVPFPEDSSLKNIVLDCNNIPNLAALQHQLSQAAEPGKTTRVVLRGELCFLFSPTHPAANPRRDNGRLLLDMEALRFSKAALHHMAAEHSVRGALTRRFVRELSSAGNAGTERTLYQTFIKCLDSLPWQKGGEL